MSTPEPRFIVCRPAFRIHDSEQAIAHYVDWLGFNLDFEWRAEHGAPTIMSVSRDSLSLFLNEDASVSEKSWLRVSVTELAELVAEWNAKRPGSLEIISEQPYEIPTVYVADPFGNGLAIQEAQSAEVERLRSQELAAAKALIEANMNRNEPIPTTAEIVAELGCSQGVASEALVKFANI